MYEPDSNRAAAAEAKAQVEAKEAARAAAASARAALQCEVVSKMAQLSERTINALEELAELCVRGVIGAVTGRTVLKAFLVRLS